MRRRLTLSIVAVTVLTLLGLGVPLGIAVQHSYLNSAVSQLQRQATEVLSEIALPLDPAALDELRNDHDAPPAAIYGSDGKRIAGAGPDEADAPVTAAMDGDSASVNN
ncbi:MAG: hypothetical protein ABIQ39_12850, partial [Ilumatobacteraceae bacterium]